MCLCVTNLNFVTNSAVFTQSDLLCVVEAFALCGIEAFAVCDGEAKDSSVVFLDRA